MGKKFVLTLKEGTDTSGFHGHRGRPGRRGGSLPEGGVSQNPDELAREELANARRTFVRRIGWAVYHFAQDHGLSDVEANTVRNIAQRAAYETIDNMNLSPDRTATLASRLPTALGMAPELQQVANAVALRLGGYIAIGGNDILRNYNTLEIFSRYLRAQDAMMSGTPQLGDFIDTTEQTGNAVTAPVESIDQILGTASTTTNTADNFISTESVDSGIRSSIQTVQNTTNGMTDVAAKNAILQAAEDQTVSSDDFAHVLLNSSSRISTDDMHQLLAYHNFLHRGEPYTTYFNNAGEVDSTKSMLRNWAANDGNSVVGARLTNILGALDNNRNFFASRQEFEDAVNTTDDMARERLSPIARARISALFDYVNAQNGVTTTQSTTPSPFRASRAARATTPPAAPVPELNTTDDFQSFSTGLTNNATQRQERIAYRALYTLATDPTVTVDKVTTSLSQFDSLYPNRLSTEQKAAFVKGWELHHGEQASVAGAMVLPDNFKSYIDKAQQGKLIQEIKDSTNFRPLDVAGAATLSGYMDDSDIETANRVVKSATGNDVDAMQFINHSYNFEAAGIWTKVTGVSVSSYGSSVEIAMDVRSKDENGHETSIGTCKRTLNADGEIHNDFLQLRTEYEGKGFGTAFYRHLEDAAVEAGFKKMTITANIDVGGYTWAAMGFDGSRSTVENYADRLRNEYSNKYHANLPVEPKHMWEIAAYRGPDGAEIGKSILLGEHWSATKNLNDSDIGFAVGRAYYVKPKTRKKA